MTGSARDAINLRWNYKDAINLATGEWTRAGYRAPACYVTNASPLVKATFSVAPTNLPVVRLFAETAAAVGGFAITNVSFSNAVAGLFPVSESLHTRFPQDVAELGWSGIGTNGNSVVWSMERNGFTDLLSADVGVFTNPAVSKMGGNLESIPPTTLYPHGRIIVGSNLTEVAKSFLRAQAVQTEDGQLVELPLDWLKVGHVDEVMAVVPFPEYPGFKVLTGDLDMALDLLQSEIAACENWLATNENDQETADYLETLENTIAPYNAPQNAERKTRVSAGCAGVRTSISTALGVAETSIVRIPCLYPLPNIGATGWNDVSTLEPNPVNMTVLVSQNGGRRILVPLPRFIVFAEKLGETFIDLGYSEDEVLFVESAGPRGWFGEVHCATNVKRSRGQ